jgi:hypothetical protein
MLKKSVPHAPTLLELLTANKIFPDHFVSPRQSGTKIYAAIEAHQDSRHCHWKSREVCWDLWLSITCSSVFTYFRNGLVPAWPRGYMRVRRARINSFNHTCYISSTNLRIRFCELQVAPNTPATSLMLTTIFPCLAFCQWRRNSKFKCQAW